MNIYLTAIVKSKPGHAEALKAILLDLVKGSKTEQACIQYDLHQDQEDENRFVFYEIWEDQAGLDLHNTQPHIQTFIAKSADIVDGGTIIYKMQKIS